MPEKKNPEADATTGAMPKVRWDDSNLRTSYANVANVLTTREEATILFGTNQAWHTGQDEVRISLSDRVILSPFAAKRLAMLLNNVVGEFEKRFGELTVGPKPEGGVQ